MSSEPLVSIMIPNFNHSRFLDQCIMSAINQTYKNLEIVILDNSSTDDSVQVASKYLSDPRVSVCRNQFNIVNQTYRVLSKLTRGKYKILLCADDYILEDFIRQAVEIMEKYPNVGYVHGERDWVTEDGEIIELDPFYKCSFVAPGHSAMAVYMMTPVAHPSQGVFRTSAFEEIYGYDKEIDHLNADRTLWFYLSYKNDAAYIREKMSRIRIGRQTETYITQKNFQHPILYHLMIEDFTKFARAKNIPAVYNRKQEALKRLAYEFLGYAVGMLRMKDFTLAQSYLLYTKIIDRDIVNNETYQSIENMVQNKYVDEDLLQNLKFFKKLEKRKRSYEPPEGYSEIQIGG